MSERGRARACARRQRKLAPTCQREKAGAALAQSPLVRSPSRRARASDTARVPCASEATAASGGDANPPLRTGGACANRPPSPPVQPRTAAQQTTSAPACCRGSSRARVDRLGGGGRRTFALVDRCEQNRRCRCRRRRLRNKRARAHERQAARARSAVERRTCARARAAATRR